MPSVHPYASQAGRALPRKVLYPCLQHMGCCKGHALQLLLQTPALLKNEKGPDSARSASPQCLCFSLLRSEGRETPQQAAVTGARLLCHTPAIQYPSPTAAQPQCPDLCSQHRLSAGRKGPATPHPPPRRAEGAAARRGAGSCPAPLCSAGGLLQVDTHPLSVCPWEEMGRPLPALQPSSFHSHSSHARFPSPPCCSHPA